MSQERLEEPRHCHLSLRFSPRATRSQHTWYFNLQIFRFRTNLQTMHLFVARIHHPIICIVDFSSPLNISFSFSPSHFCASSTKTLSEQVDQKVHRAENLYSGPAGRVRSKDTGGSCYGTGNGDCVRQGERTSSQSRRGPSAGPDSCSRPRLSSEGSRSRSSGGLSPRAVSLDR